MGGGGKYEDKEKRGRGKGDDLEICLLDATSRPSFYKHSFILSNLNDPAGPPRVLVLILTRLRETHSNNQFGQFK